LTAQRVPEYLSEARYWLIVGANAIEEVKVGRWNRPDNWRQPGKRYDESLPLRSVVVFLRELI
jgi:hypothetical protein